MKVNIMDISTKYEINSASEGGYIVTDPGVYPQPTAAFTNATDLIVWLAKKHGITVHAIAAGGTNISVSLPLVGEKPSDGALKQAVQKAVGEAIRDRDARFAV